MMMVFCTRISDDPENESCSGDTFEYDGSDFQIMPPSCPICCLPVVWIPESVASKEEYAHDVIWFGENDVE